MFVYYKLYREPVSQTISTTLCGNQEKIAVPSIEVVHENNKERSDHFTFFFFFLKERPPSLLANQLLLFQPQQAPHKHEEANPEYLLHWH